jgi:hypothetical protein
MSSFTNFWSCKVLLDGVQRHASPAESLQQEGVFRKEIAEAPSQRRHDPELAPAVSSDRSVNTN